MHTKTGSNVNWTTTDLEINIPPRVFIMSIPIKSYPRGPLELWGSPSQQPFHFYTNDVKTSFLPHSADLAPYGAGAPKVHKHNALLSTYINFYHWQWWVYMMTRKESIAELPSHEPFPDNLGICGLYYCSYNNVGFSPWLSRILQSLAKRLRPLHWLQIMSLVLLRGDGIVLRCISHSTAAKFSSGFVFQYHLSMSKYLLNGQYIHLRRSQKKPFHTIW